MMKVPYYSVVLCLVTQITAQTETSELVSPSGNLTLSFFLSDMGRPTYSLRLGDEVVVGDSGMGFEFFNRGAADPDARDNFYEGFQLTQTGGAVPPIEKPETYDETWTPVWGEESEIRDHHNEMLVHLVQPGQSSGPRYMDIRFRLFDEGLGFRYEFPQQRRLIYFEVAEELTEFKMTDDHTAWWIPGDYDTQEYRYQKTKLSKIPEKYTDAITDDAIAGKWPFLNGVQTAFQMKSEPAGGEPVYINIHEAALVNYSAMHLEINDLTLRSHLTPDAVGVKGHLQAPNVSPWRTIIASKDPRDILRSRITYNLNEPPTGNFSWVKPVKYMGVWWEMITNHRRWDYTLDFRSIQLGVTDYEGATPHGKHGANKENVKAYIDFAAKHGFDALLVEGWNIGWEDWFGNGKDYVFDFLTPYPDFPLEEIQEYAKNNSLKLIMHHETSGSTRNYERHMDRAYQFMVDHDYSAVKSGYVGYILPDGEHHFSQDIVNHYLVAVQKAAEYEICVNAHEAVRPTGLARTYPNLIANEAARGQEYQAFSGTPPSHVAILPFTRQLGGPMDYTPGIFQHDLYNWVDGAQEDLGHGPEWRVQSTIAHQLALYVTMYSPLQVAADLYSHYEKYLDAFQFIKDVPVDWERSEYIEAEPGDYITIARLDKATKKDWYIGSINGNGSQEGGVAAARTVTFTPDFLDGGVCYWATIYHDKQDTTHYWNDAHVYEITTEEVKADTPISQWVAEGGGFAIKLEHQGAACTPPTAAGMP